jgi:hypothetical protein
MLAAVPELGGNIDVVLPSVIKVVDMLELDCMLELLLDAPLLDPVDGPETPVGVIHFDAGPCAVRLVAEDHWNSAQGIAYGLMHGVTLQSLFSAKMAFVHSIGPRNGPSMSRLKHERKSSRRPTSSVVSLVSVCRQGKVRKTEDFA